MPAPGGFYYAAEGGLVEDNGPVKEGVWPWRALVFLGHVEKTQTTATITKQNKMETSQKTASKHLLKSDLPTSGCLFGVDLLFF